MPGIKSKGLRSQLEEAPTDQRWDSMNANNSNNGHKLKYIKYI